MTDYKQKALDALALTEVDNLQGQAQAYKLQIGQLYASLAIIERLDTNNAYFEAMLKHWDVKVPDYPLSKPTPDLSED